MLAQHTNQLCNGTKRPDMAGAIGMQVLWVDLNQAANTRVISIPPGCTVLIGTQTKATGRTTYITMLDLCVI
jgi:hypothetical protein